MDRKGKSEAEGRHGAVFFSLPPLKKKEEEEEVIDQILSERNRYIHYTTPDFFRIPAVSN